MHLFIVIADWGEERVGARLDVHEARSSRHDIDGKADCPHGEHFPFRRHVFLGAGERVEEFAPSTKTKWTVGQKFRNRCLRILG